MKKFSKVCLAGFIGVFITACGGSVSSDSNTTQTSTNTGVFTDSPVQNLYYETSSGIKGYTDNQGKFQYRSGDKVTFKVGDLVLGTVIGSSVLTPMNFSSDFNKTYAIADVLQNLDTDGNLSNGIQLPDEKIMEKISLKKDINLSDAQDLDNQIAKIKNELKKYNKNYNFLDVNFSKVPLVLMMSNGINYIKYVIPDKTSYIYDTYSKQIYELSSNKVLELNGTVIGNYSVNGSLDWNKIDFSQIINSSSSIPVVTSTETDSETAAETDPGIMDINISDNVSSISNVMQYGEYWILNTLNGYRLIQTGNKDNLLLLKLGANRSFKVNENENLYFAEYNQTSGVFSQGSIELSKDGNATIEMNGKKFNALVDDSGVLYSVDNNFVLYLFGAVLDPSDNVLVITNPQTGDTYLIAAQEYYLEKTMSLIKEKGISNYLNSLRFSGIPFMYYYNSFPSGDLTGGITVTIQ